jgi:hypothetical protein
MQPESCRFNRGLTNLKSIQYNQYYTSMRPRLEVIGDCGKTVNWLRLIDPEKWMPVFPRDKREALARRSCSNKRRSCSNKETRS